MRQSHSPVHHCALVLQAWAAANFIRKTTGSLRMGVSVLLCDADQAGSYCWHSGRFHSPEVCVKGQENWALARCGSCGIIALKSLVLVAPAEVV